ncbi:uncharacterized protein UBRO_01088 [Ustilago bromivora]|uniref:GATA-type domain-containing protein n=1 Tax=Ustilago bromivora TaxID=307758 RepID=A0A1K0FV01_9BASI|nr:uncharacterized protein UBRO_01088 [Ustilago bromivora]SYW77804.1 uncharacterized protein UBRO2_01996 [Ustilago bromivora]
MSIGSEGASSDSIQVHPGPASAGSTSSSANPASNVDSLPCTPSPPPSSKAQTSLQPQSQPQQQQIQQQRQPAPPPPPQQQQTTTKYQQQLLPKSQQNDALTTKSDASSAPAVTQTPQRPPPPVSAVSLHDAAAKAAAAKAANAVNGGAPQSVTPIAPKQPATQTTAPSSQSGQQSAATNAESDASAAPKKVNKAKANKQPGSTGKPKQKRRANQVKAQDDLVYHPAPSTAGGTIGAAPDATIPAMLTAAGGGRKALPELVLPFQLPYTDIRPEMPMLDNASVQAAMAMGASETSSLDTGSDSDDYSVMSDDSDLDSEAEESRREARRRRREPATIEESLVLLQSLRQSRLSHLSSLLTPFSQRVRSGMIYPNVLPLSLLHGLNPREPHILIQLGRADIHVGPHVFMKTKFWEVRPDYELPPAMNPIGGLRGPVSYGGRPSYARMAPSQPLPQPHTPQLPSPRAMPSVPQPAVPLARPPTASTKPPIVRPAAPAVPASSNAMTAATSAVSKPAAMPTPTLPATPIAGPAAARPIAPAKTQVTAPTAASSTSASTPATTAASTQALKPVSTASAPAAATPPTPVKPAVTSTSASGATATATSNAESKPATTVSTPVTLAPKSIAMPVSLPRPPMVTPSLPRPPSINQNNIPSSANPASAPSAGGASASNSASGASAAPKPAAPTTASSSKPTASASATAAPASASSSAPTTATTPAVVTVTQAAPAAGQASTAPKPPANAVPNAGAAPAPGRPAGPPPPPAIDAVLVSRVNATAALNPELQELLHIAASGKANPSQLKALGVWIQAITAQLRQDEARNAAAANNAAAASGSRAGASASTTADGKKTKKSKVDEAAKTSKKQAKIEEREAKKKAKAEAKAKAQADKQQAQKQQKEKQQMLQQQHQMQQHQHQAPVSNKLRHPPPGWPTDGPPEPPVIIVEFRENPSMRFILPLWKCLVERTEGMERPSAPKVKKERRGFFDNDSEDEESQRIEPELKLSFFAPSLGSDAADGSGLCELEEELKRKAAEEAKLNAASAPSTPAQSSTSANGTASPTASPEVVDKKDEAASRNKKKGSTAAGGKKGNKAVKQEATDTSLSLDYSQSKKHEVYPLTWSIKGGVTESLWQAFGRVPGTMTLQPAKREPEIELEPDVAEFLVPEIRYHLLDLPMEEIKIQKETTDTFVDLYSQMPDRRFILPRVAPAMLPQGLEDHLQDRFAVRPQCIQGRPIVKRKAGAQDDVSFSYEGIGLTVIGPNGVKTEPGATPPKPPKRKRHVATHNPDGSIKSCGACGKTKTPMWRRGPKGPSQLCNACGARWKAGRLVVPEVAPPPIIEAEEDKSKEEEARKEDEAKASMHGSNALVIPQSSDVDGGSYTAMAPSGLVGGAAPFGDHGGNGLFSLPSDVGSSHMGRGSTSTSPFIRSPVPEDGIMPASVDPSMLSGSIRVGLHRR